MAELLRFAGLEVEVMGLPGARGEARVKLGGEQYEVMRLKREGSRLSFEFEGRTWRFDVAVGLGSTSLDGGQAVYRAQRIIPGEGNNDPPPGEMVSKMPGTVLKLLVEPGTRVEAGTPLLILEAMKMEHQIAAPEPGTVTRFPVSEGQRVMPGNLLVDFAPGD